MFCPLSLILFVLAFAASCCAQATTFQWKFADNFVSTSLAECQNMSIVVESHNNDGVTFGVPPYYFRASPVGGIPTFILAGSDRNALSWLVDQAAGSSLMLSMVDSNGSSGGIAPELYGVIPGNTSCFPSPPTSEFTVHANISTSLQTCQPWGMTIKGGVQPYTVTLATLDSPIITNVTLGPLDDVFTFIDRADPNTQLMAVVNDANGQFANGSAIVSTKGSTDVDCTGLVSSSGNSTQMAAQAAAQAAANASHARTHRRNSIIVGVVVPVVVLILIIGAVLWLLARSRKEALGIMAEQDTMPRSFEVEQAVPLTISAPQYQARNTSRKAQLSATSVTITNNTSESSDPLLSASPVTRGSSSTSDQANAYHPSQFPASPTTAAGGSSPSRGKAVNAYTRATRSVGEAFRPSINRHLNRGASGQVDPDIEPDIIIQHRDGGVVQELPPPYADRSRRS